MSTSTRARLVYHPATWPYGRLRELTRANVEVFTDDGSVGPGECPGRPLIRSRGAGAGGNAITALSRPRPLRERISLGKNWRPGSRP